MLPLSAATVCPEFRISKTFDVLLRAVRTGSDDAIPSVGLRWTEQTARTERNIWNDDPINLFRNGLEKFQMEKRKEAAEVDLIAAQIILGKRKNHAIQRIDGILWLFSFTLK